MSDRLCLAGLEVPFVSICAMVADAMAKAAGIRLLGFEPTGVETILIRIGSDNPAALGLALARGKALAVRLGVEAPASTLLAHPDPAISHLNLNPVTKNSIYEGREEMRPANRLIPETMKNQAIGILETQGLAAVLEGTDTMLKAANVQLVGKEKIGAAYVAIMIRGDVAAVQAAIDAGASAVKPLGKLIAAHVITRPHEELLKLLPAL